MDGYLKIPRGLWQALDNGEPLSPREATVWLLGQVTFKTTKLHRFNGETFELRRGEMVTTFTVMERAFRWPRAKVARFLRFLQETGWITRRVENGVTHITFCSDAIIRAGRNGADAGAERVSEQSAERTSTQLKRCNIGRKPRERNRERNANRNADRNARLPISRITKVPIPSEATPPSESGVPPRAAVPPNGKVVDLAKYLFDGGVEYLCSEGQDERKARTLLGKWRRDHGDAAVIDVLSRAQREAVTEPVGWIEAALGGRRRSGNGDEFSDTRQRREAIARAVEDLEAERAGRAAGPFRGVGG